MYVKSRPRHAVLARGPFAVSDEPAYMRARNRRRHHENSCGGATATKLGAARTVGIPVVVIDRPQAIGACTVAGIEAAVAWLESLHSSRASAR